MNKKKSIILLVCLVVLLGAVNAAWMITYNKTITTNVIGEEESYSFTYEFSNLLSLDTSNKRNSTITNLTIAGLDEDINMSFDVETRRYNATETCLDYEDDCLVTITHIYDGGPGEVRNVLSNTTNIGSDGNFILIGNTDNIIEYKIECVKKSCPQEINSTIELEEIVDSY